MKRKGHQGGLTPDLKMLEGEQRTLGLLLGWEPSEEDVKLFWMLVCLHSAEGRDGAIDSKLRSECRNDLMEMCGEALADGNHDFFRRLSIMMKRGPLGGLGDGVLPIDWMLLWYKEMMQPRDYSWVITKKDRERLQKLSAYNVNGAKRQLPPWPPSAKELHELVNSQVKCTDRTIRDAAERVGLPLRPDPMGRGRRKESE
jgi:hypothetical protein